MVFTPIALMPDRSQLDLRAGAIVTVRSKEEILATLDSNGDLDALPLMPEMLAFCGQQFRVYKRADKTCDTIDNTGSRRLHDTVHLEMLRCDGSAHGGCEAGCLLFFKEAWLRPDAANNQSTAAAAVAPTLNEADLRRACTTGLSAENQVTYRCQATQLKAATVPLKWWDARQYIRDFWTRNATVRQMVRGFAYAGYRAFLNIGRGYRFKVALYGHWQRLMGIVPFPWRGGETDKSPQSIPEFKPGDWVRVKALDLILTTLDKSNKNRGLWWDPEMVKHCGRVYRVQKRVHRIIHEKQGFMIEFRNPPILLENVYCCGEMTRWRLFCPRAILIYWRDIWLERADAPSRDQMYGRPCY